MNAPIVDEFACTAHAEGSVQDCGPCATVRRRQKAWMQRYDTPMKGAAFVSPRDRRGRISDVVVSGAQRGSAVIPEDSATEGAFPRVILARFADNQGNTGEDRNRSLHAVLKSDGEGAAPTGRVALAQRFVEEVEPVAVVGARVEGENGSVVVQLDSHGRKRIARRVLAVAAVAALALWAVAS